MKYQILFSGKKKNIYITNLSPDEFALRWLGVKVCLLYTLKTHKEPITTVSGDILFFFFFFTLHRNQDLIFHVNCLLCRWFTWNFMPYFLEKQKIKCCPLQLWMAILAFSNNISSNLIYLFILICQYWQLGAVKHVKILHACSFDFMRSRQTSLLGKMDFQIRLEEFSLFETAGAVWSGSVCHSTKYFKNNCIRSKM